MLYIKGEFRWDMMEGQCESSVIERQMHTRTTNETDFNTLTVSYKIADQRGNVRPLQIEAVTSSDDAIQAPEEFAKKTNDIINKFLSDMYKAVDPPPF